MCMVYCDHGSLAASKSAMPAQNVFVEKIQFKSFSRILMMIVMKGAMKLAGWFPSPNWGRDENADRTHGRSVRGDAESKTTIGEAYSRSVNHLYL